MNMSSSFPSGGSPLSVEAMQRLMAGELSMRTRLGYTALLVISTAMTGVVGALWLTEPSLPLLTQVAFGVMVAIGISWAVFALQVLVRRHVLLARHRVIAARMAVAFSVIFFAGIVLAGYTTDRRTAAYAAGIYGLTMLLVAVGMLRKSNRELAGLLRERDRLEKGK
ncbi:MAG: hypothetical protein ACREUZ_15820 [Burkholderiales bacterium]